MHSPVLSLHGIDVEILSRCACIISSEKLLLSPGGVKNSNITVGVFVWFHTNTFSSPKHEYFIIYSTKYGSFVDSAPLVSRWTANYLFVQFSDGFCIHRWNEMQKSHFHLFSSTRNTQKFQTQTERLSENFIANVEVCVQRSIETEFVTVEWSKY